MEELFFELDKGTLQQFRIGADLPTESESTHIVNQKSGYAIGIVDNTVSSIFACLNVGYEEYSEFRGQIILGGEVLDLDCGTSFEEVSSKLGTPVEHWNDGIEECGQFVVSGNLVEFVWSVVRPKPILQYVSVEKQTS